jgi:nucleotide-binding universal stress UspA family protein
MNFRKILIAVDGSAFAARAADAGLDLARSLSGEIAFVTVIDPAAARGAALTGVAADEWAAMAERDARNLLAAFHDRAAAQPGALTFLERGRPAAQILKAAAEWAADVIVVGTHGRGAVESIVLGSVAEGVLHHARCPVLVIRAEG